MCRHLAFFLPLLLANCADYSLPATYFTDREELAGVLESTLELLNTRLGCQAFISGSRSPYVSTRSVNVTIGPLDDQTWWGSYDPLRGEVVLKQDLNKHQQLIVLLHELAHSADVVHDREPDRLMSKKVSRGLYEMSDAELIDAFVEVLGNRSPCGVK